MKASAIKAHAHTTGITPDSPGRLMYAKLGV